ncbi:conserved hypothetical protein [Vibrio cholerae O1 biovar El Tor str. N16961]|uniref:Uncharacterized protein n=2 Tax=Vibrio cholerae TaxID=666 RepID=Q9KNS9_VIBCH|nr:conserved hypothetical protein [Vibrio cholerae O1 biovar El Tor str. N16961]ACP06868.1 conserved hypothetical protein [Vibrio cholerae M66-2]ACP10750.1 conserved hypothetical protein [Vibrio cholerae O395]
MHIAVALCILFLLKTQSRELCVRRCAFLSLLLQVVHEQRVKVNWSKVQLWESTFHH